MDLACQWYLKAANQGHVTAQVLLAEAYESGIGVPISFKDSLRYYTMAAEAGDGYAKCKVGVAYECGGRGLAQDRKRAVQLYKEATTARTGKQFGEYYLAWCFEIGFEVDKDEKKAIELYALSAEHGQVQARVRLLKMLESGRDGGTLSNLLKDVERFRPLAEQQDREAQQKLSAVCLSLRHYWIWRQKLLSH